jgi:hypothetical protein
VIIEVGGVGMTVASWLAVFTGNMAWHPAKAKVVSKTAVSDRLWVIVLLHQKTPAPHRVTLRNGVVRVNIGIKTTILSVSGEFFDVVFFRIFK